MSAPAATKTTRNALVLIIASVLSNGIQFIWQFALATALGPQGIGIYGTVLSLMGVSSAVAGFGLGPIFIRDVARDPQAISRYWTARLFLQTILGGLAYIMAVGAALLAGYDHLIVAYTAIGALSLLIDILGTITADLLIAQERMTLRAAIEIGCIVLRVLVAALFLSFGWGLIGVYIATLATGVLRTVLYWGAHTIKGFWPKMPLDRPLTWRFFWDSAPLAAAGFFNLLYQHIDKLITTALIGVIGTGYLGPAFTISMGVIEVLNTTVLTALFPYMARLYVDDRKAYDQLVATMTRLVFVISLPVSLTITLFAEPIVLMIFKEQFAPTIGVLRFLIWFTFLTMIGNVLVQAMQVQNQQKRVLWIRAGGLILNVIFTTGTLVLFRDAAGAALSAAIAQAFVLALLFTEFPGLMAHARTGTLYVGRIALIGAVTGAVMLAVGQIHFIAGIVIGLIVYTVLGWIWGLADDDRALMHQILAVIPGQAWLRTRLAAR